MELKSAIVAIIQARMGSSRLPGKSLKIIQGKPMLWHIVNRLNMVDKIDRVVIATSNLPEDDSIYQMAEKFEISCFRGSESDVLKRFFDAAAMVKADHVIRITGDCPLVDPLTIRQLIKLYFDGNYDFCGVACGAGVANEININRFPDGLDAEIFSFKTLQEAQAEADTDLQREHVTPFIWKNRERYASNILYPETRDFSDLRWTVDNQVDFDFIKWVYNQLYPLNNDFTLHDVMALLEKYPDAAYNKHLIGQEGYEEFWE
jgi:spore coat polysaccharide biosynthesis protein SpsF